MAVYYRYRSGVETFSVPVPGPSITVAELKRLILGTARHGHGRTRGRGPREGIALSDAQTGEEYADDAAPLRRNTTVLVRRVAGPPAETIVTASSPQAPKSAQQHARGSSSSSSATSSASTAARSTSPAPVLSAPTPPPAPVIPAELHCKICKNVMADAVLASKCCFDSFCDRCVRDRIAESSRCACGAPARADDLIPNPAIRTTITNLLAASGATEKPRSSVGSNATPAPAASQESNVTFEKKFGAGSEHSNGSGSSSTSKTTTTRAAHGPQRNQSDTSTRTAEVGASHADHHYGGAVPFAPACYNPFFGGMPWVADPYMYYGSMAYPAGGCYPMPAGPLHRHHVGAMYGAPAPPPPSYGHHGRKRTDREDRRQEERSFKKRCGSQVGV